MIVSPPKLPAELQACAPVPLVPAITLELGQYPRLAWANDHSKRPSFDAVRFTEPDMTSTSLREGGWADVEIIGGLLAAADLTGSTIRRVRIRGVRASGLIVAETEGKDITIGASKLDLANFRFANWSRIEFNNCSFLDADFAGSKFTDIVFSDCDLSGCDFSGAALTRVDLRSSTLSDISGPSGLKGATITTGQLMALAPLLASYVGIIVRDS
jgi:uncharacterized protein YjbI with pentapeptide repeats